MPRRAIRHAVWVCATLFAIAAHAQDYPNKPIRLVVPFPPAGATDLLSRIVAQKLSERLGQQVLVENKSGAGANLGAEFVAKSAPDGYTLLMAPSSVYAVGVTLYKKVPFDLVKDLAPVSTIAIVPHILNVNPELPVTSVNELIALAKAKPRQLNMASQGTGTTSHLEGELFNTMAGIEMTHVPYKGSTPAIQDLIAGNVQVMFDSIAASQSQIKVGRLRALAVLGSQRSVLLPNVPTVAEAALPGFKSEAWLGIMAPAQTPKPIITRLNKELMHIVAEPVAQKQMIAAGFDPQSSTPEQFSQYIKDDIEQWGNVVKATGATVD